MQKIIYYAIGILLAGMAWLASPPLVQAQSPVPEVWRASATGCVCGRWTCPACQQRMLCPPQGSQLPYTPLRPQGPDEFGWGTPPSQDSNTLNSPYSVVPPPAGSGVSPGSPSVGGLDNQAAGSGLGGLDSIDTSNLFASNLAAGTAGGFGSSLRGATTPEMMGDFFGPGAMASIIAQTYAIDTDNVQPGGGGISILELDGDMPANDFFSTAPAIVHGDGSRTIDLDAPNDPNDVARPAGAGYTYQSGHATQQDSGSNWVGSYSYGKSILVPSGGYVLGRLKIAENFSPVPRDRVFFNYSLFNNVPLTTNGTSVNRFTPGFEKAFYDGLLSLEVRSPFGATLSSDILADGVTDTQHVEFGNMLFALKGLMMERKNWLLTSGLSVSVPTADDTRVLAGDGTELLRISNEAVHVMPFLGMLYTPSDKFFAQGLMQYDIDVNGNSVSVNNGTGLANIGSIHDMTFLYLDASLGYWLKNNPRDTTNIVTGIAPIMEFHLNRSLSNADTASDGITLVQNPVQEFDNLNILGGLILNIRNRSRLGFGYAVPLGNGSDRVFDSEARVTFNRYF
ncbi:hypothetical protein [Aureliella helgolandensis]|uniref:Uncharacterized protein n=1 Tax=Aureliella helgolandensis TaxID=2527968 RepID=A0A518GAD9_9BACT|nr:hypothetical protein [Aureliella helgolandensis]QDV25554.1 hypothetical protein Q31a_38800 [Aureliella helgolandensis]